MTDGKQQGVRDGSKFRGLRPVGTHGSLPQIWRPCLCCCLPAPLLFGFWGLVQVPFWRYRVQTRASVRVSLARCLYALSTLTHTCRDGPVGCSGEALVDVEKMANWEEIRRTACVCTHVQPRCHRALPPAWKVIWVWIISVTYSHILVFVSRVMIQKRIFTPIGADYWQCVCVWCLCVFKGDMCLIFIAYWAFLSHDINMLFIHVAAIWLIQLRGEMFQVNLNWKKKEY